ncbi:hypothetical protein [Kangiella japonica]|uniref:hypothetical protein n=1 Tax=Kangiella japonica TaxID=647384 RepID=UPI0031DB62CF
MQFKSSNPLSQLDDSNIRFLEYSLQKKPYKELFTHPDMEAVWRTLLDKASELHPCLMMDRSVMGGAFLYINIFLIALDKATNFNKAYNRLTQNEKRKKLEKAQIAVNTLLSIIDNLDIDQNLIEEMPQKIINKISEYKSLINLDEESLTNTDASLSYLVHGRGSDLANVVLSIESYSLLNSLKHYNKKLEELMNEKSIISSPNAVDAEELFFIRTITRSFCITYGQPFYNQVAIISSIYFGKEFDKESIRYKVKNFVPEWKECFKKGG